MSTKQQAEKSTELKTQESGLLEAVVGDNVIFDLGKPIGLRRVQVKCVWGDHYRVNIFVGDNSATAKIAHTFFLETDANGKILSSCPPITKMY